MTDVPDIKLPMFIPTHTYCSFWTTTGNAKLNAKAAFFTTHVSTNQLLWVGMHVINVSSKHSVLVPGTPVIIDLVNTHIIPTFS